MSDVTKILIVDDDPDIRNASLCCECGVCEIYACPMGLRPRTINGMLKQKLGAAGIRYKSDPSVTWKARPEREERKAPSEKVASRAGVHKYYDYTIEHEEVFSFVEQCSRCPTLSENVSEKDCSHELFDMIHEYQQRGELKTYSDLNIAAMLFPPVRFIAMNSCQYSPGPEEQLSELIRMLQDLLLM